MTSKGKGAVCTCSRKFTRAATKCLVTGLASTERHHAFNCECRGSRCLCNWMARARRPDKISRAAMNRDRALNVVSVNTTGWRCPKRRISTLIGKDEDARSAKAWQAWVEQKRPTAKRRMLRPRPCCHKNPNLACKARGFRTFPHTSICCSTAVCGKLLHGR